MSHFDIDEYAYLESPFHSFDPRAKFVSVLVLMFSIVLLNDIRILAAGLLLAVALVLVSRIPLLFVMGRLKWVALFVLAVVIVLPFSVSGTALFSVGSLTFTKEGLLQALVISVKAFSVVLLIFPMLATMKFVSFIKALEKLHVPNRLVQMITLTYRYIFVLLNEIQRTLRSIESRGYGKRTSILGLKNLGTAIGMLLVRSYERGGRIFDAMVSRGYNGTMETLREFEINSKDWAKAVSIVAVAVLLHVAAFTSSVYLGAI